MHNELVRIRTSDSLELQGLLFEPQAKTGTALVHVHGWVGNFYEDKFLDFIAAEALKRGIAFLTFNNRGAGMVTDFIKRKKEGFEYVRVGGCVEKFDDCILDIKAAVDFLAARGYNEIMLEGHSTGCQKASYYAFKTKDKRVKGVVLLAPVDDVAVAKRMLGKRYDEAMSIAKKMAEEGKAGSPVPEWMAFYPLLTAETFLSVADPESNSGRMFNYGGKMSETRNITAPMLAVFGTKDEYQDKPEEKLAILQKIIKQCDIKLLEGNHWYSGSENELATAVVGWIKKII